MASLSDILKELKAFPHILTVEQSASWMNMLQQISFSKADIDYDNDVDLSGPPSAYGATGINISTKTSPAFFESIIEKTPLAYADIYRFQICVQLDQTRIKSYAATMDAVPAHVAIQTLVHEFVLHVKTFAERIKSIKDDDGLKKLINEVNFQKSAGLNTPDHASVYNAAHLYNKILNEIILKMYTNYKVTHVMWLNYLKMMDIDDKVRGSFRPGQLGPGYLDDIVLTVDTPANKFIDYLNKDDESYWNEMNPGMRPVLFTERKKFYYSAPWDPATPGDERAYLWDSKVESKITRMHRHWMEGP